MKAMFLSYARSVLSKNEYFNSFLENIKYFSTSSFFFYREEVITEKMTGAEILQRSGSSTCLLPCVSDKCDRYRCCSKLRQKKSSKSSSYESRNQRSFSTNPCFVNIDIYTSGNTSSPTASRNKQFGFSVMEQSCSEA